MSTMKAAVEFRGLTKRFGDCYANRSIDLKVGAGTIHAIIGENGAGKSTAMKMLYGMIRPDSGEILIHGRRKEWGSPRDAIRCGVGMVHQHFMLAGPYSVLENVLLGAESSKPIWNWLPRFLRPLDRRGAKKKLEAISRQYGLRIDPNARVEDLSVGIHQRIEIVKLLFRDAEILILDEPTAVLTPRETTELFVYLRKLRSEGKTILIITHKLREVLELADEATVFRAGQVVGHREMSETDADDLASLMVGRKVNLRVSAPDASQPGEPVLEVRDLSLKVGHAEKLRDLNFSVRSGEVVGIAGVEGNGQSELLQILLHPQDFARAAAGRISCLGRVILEKHSGLSNRKIKSLGVGAIPEDRHREGLLLNRPVTESFLLGFQRRKPYSRNGILSESDLKAQALRAMEEYDVRPRSLSIDAGRFSGGNQQKLIIAREFQDEPRFLIAAQPTRGVDVGAIELIHGKIFEARARGAGILLVSSELDEVVALSDRVLVMYEGRLVAEFRRGEADEKTLGIYMGGGKPEMAKVTG